MITPDTVRDYLRQAVTGARREYPNLPGLLLTGPVDPCRPRALHPAFYGCFDWHSAVHTHWTLARLCRLFPDAPGTDQARAVLADHLTEANLAVEAEYLAEQPWFERPYGRAWALALAAELRRWAAGPADSGGSGGAGGSGGSGGGPAVADWSRAVEPLVETVCAGFTDWLPRLGYPVRTGTHTNTAFALLLALDAAPELGRPGADLADLVRRRTVDWFGGDEDYPTRYEPSGGDFLSAALVEAALLCRVLPAAEFVPWFDRFLPGLAAGRVDRLLVPVDVPDRGDPHGVHLDGLNLSRAWCWRDLADALPADDPRRSRITDAAAAHLAAALPYVSTGDFLGEHWLATFAVLATT